MSKRKAAYDGAGPSGHRRRKNDENDDDDESDEEEIMDLSQNPDFRVDQQEAEVGIIEKISLKNFMNHNRLDVVLGPHVNFVIGRNGSGKSAVVTALVVGLGGKASLTSRGNTVKSFIKTGKHSAEVEIRLRNRGSDAYKHDEYGDAIILERKLTSDGSSYKIKSKDGRVVSKSRDELDRIRDQFNIQVDNPVAILNQDTSKNFLNSKSSHDKYKFFLKATQLEQMKHDYSMANEEREYTKDIIEQKEQTLPKLQKEVLDWEQKFKALDALGLMREKIKKLKNEMAWAIVAEKEKGLQPFNKELGQEESRMPKFIQKAEETKAVVDQCVKKQKEIQERLKAMGEEVERLQPQYETAKKNQADKKKVVRNSMMDMRKVESSLSTMRKEKSQIQDRIKELQTSAQHDYESERRAREEKIRQTEEQVSGLRSQQRTTEHQLEQFRSAITKYQKDEYSLNNDLQALRSHIDKTQRQLQNLMAAKSDRLKRFGPHVPALIQHIDQLQRSGKFHQRPRGPIGACFQLKDSRWALAAENCLRSMIHAFCCHDHHDEKVLEEIFARVCPNDRRPSIIVSRFKDRVYDVSVHKAQSNKFCTVLDVIDCDDPVILNTLIDQRNVEGIILIPDAKEARLTMDPNKRPGPPKNVREAFTSEGDQLYCHPSLRYYSNNMDKARWLTSSVEEDITNLEAELHKQKQDINLLTQQKTQLNADIKKNQMEERKTETQLMKISNQVQNLTYEINEMKSIEDPAPVDVTTLEEEVENLDDQIQNLDRQRNEKKATHQRLQEEQKTADAAYQTIEQQMREKADEAQPLQDNLSAAQIEIEQAKLHRKHYESKLKEQEKKINDLKKRVEQYQKDLKVDIGKAQQICEEKITTRRTPRNLESEITHLNERIKTEEKSRGNPEEITRKYAELKESYLKIKKEVSQLKKFIEQLDKVMLHRQHQYAEFRKMIAMRAKYFFIVLLGNRQYTGKMTFNHPKETLEMSVQPNQMAEGRVSTDMKALSGGERSFATVCFILALWDAMESPFRCLDEFDVFMDMVNRRISMDMMMDVAKHQTGKQFIFLTPQDMSQLGVTCNSLKIFRMPDPDRQQRTLPFQPANKKRREHGEENEDEAEELTEAEEN